jgi:short-subunit dehydrogenase
MRRQARLRERYGPWAVVTGASEGIGRASAVVLAGAGVHLVLVARRGDRLDAIARELVAAHGIEVQVVAADLGTSEGVASVVQQTARLDVGLLVAAAGFGTSGAFLDVSLEDELAMIDVNCRAVVALAQAFGARLARRRRGGLVLFSSVVAFQGVPRATTYAATKAFVQTFAEGLGAELRPFGVDVLASAPGPVHSGFAARASMTMGAALSPEEVARGTLHALGRRRTTRPGGLSKVLGFSLLMLPRQARTRIMGLVMAGMTRHAAPAPPARA